MPRMSPKKNLDMYKRLNEEEAIILSRRIEDEYGGRRYGEAWKVINGITRRKKSKDGLVKGNMPQERVNSWFNHYSSLLGTESALDDPEEEIQTVFRE